MFWHQKKKKQCNFFLIWMIDYWSLTVKCIADAKYVYIQPFWCNKSRDNIDEKRYQNLNNKSIYAYLFLLNFFLTYLTTSPCNFHIQQSPETFGTGRFLELVSKGFVREEFCSAVNDKRRKLNDQSSLYFNPQTLMMTFGQV